MQSKKYACLVVIVLAGRNRLFSLNGSTDKLKVFHFYSLEKLIDM